MVTRLRRASALIAAAWLLVGVVFGARHEAQEAHAIDAHGEAVHASHLVGDHKADHSDIHGVTDASANSEPCAILSALHQACNAHVSPPAVAAVMQPANHAIAPVASVAGVAVAVYRLAPKTSPPTA